MIVGGLFFAKRIRATGATTMIDPLQKVYGRFAGALLVIPGNVLKFDYIKLNPIYINISLNRAKPLWVNYFGVHLFWRL